MSQYVNFFVKTNDNHFYPIGSYSRNSALYSVLAHLPYEKVTKLEADRLMKATVDIHENVRRDREYIEELKKEIEQICSFNNDIDEKIAAIGDFNSLIKETQESIDEYIYADNFITFIQNMIDDSDGALSLYAGIECGYPTVEDIVE